jgi:uncharacterized membrane protein
MSIRNLALLLGISVVLNVLLVGFWAGQLARRGHQGRGAETFDGRAMRGVWKRHDAMLRPRSEALEASRRKVTEALLAEPFQPAALETALSQLRAETDGAQRALHGALVDSARDLSPEERRQMATSGWLVGPGPRRGGR